MVLAAAAALTSCVQAPAPAIAPGEMEACSQTKDLDRAIAVCSELIGAGSKNAQLYINRGFAYALKNDIDHAAPDLNEAVKLAPKNPDAFIRRGFVLHARGDDAGAIADYTRAISLGANDPQVYLDRGTAHFAKGDNAQAIADYTTVIERDAGKTFVGQLALALRGLALMYSGAPEKAQADLKRAFELNPKDPFFAIFLHLAEKRTGSPGSLAAAASTFDKTRWPAPAIRMFLGEGPPEDVLAVKGGPVTICEADYLAAEYMLLQSRQDEALQLYRKAGRDCPRHVLEGITARAALRSLGAAPG